jgi:hypothetical protein
MKLNLSEEEVRIIIKILKRSSPDQSEQEAVVNLVRWLEHILEET